MSSIQQIERIDKLLSRQIKNVTVGVVAVVVARNISQAVAMTITDVGRRVVDLKMPIKFY